MWKIYSTDKRDRILVVKNSSFQLQIHDDVHVTFIRFKRFLIILKQLRRKIAIHMFTQL